MSPKIDMMIVQRRWFWRDRVLAVLYRSDSKLPVREEWAAIAEATGSYTSRYVSIQHGNFIAVVLNADSIGEPRPALWVRILDRLVDMMMPPLQRDSKEYDVL